MSFSERVMLVALIVDQWGQTIDWMLSVGDVFGFVFDVSISLSFGQLQTPIVFARNAKNFRNNISVLTYFWYA